MREGLRKLEGVEAVEVSLNRGLATITLAAGNEVRLQQVWAVVNEKGFTPKEAKVVAQGELLAGEGKPRFKISGSNETYELATEPEAREVADDIRKHRGRAVTIEGEVPAPKGKTGAAVIRVSSVKPA